VGSALDAPISIAALGNGGKLRWERWHRRKEKVARAFAVCSVRGLQYSERAGARDGGILDPVVLLRLVFRFASGARDQQRFRIQAVEGAIGDDEDFPVFCVLRRNVFGRRSFAGSTRMR